MQEATYADIIIKCLFCWHLKGYLFDLIIYIPVNNFSVMSGLFFLGRTSTNQVLISEHIV